MAIVLNISRRSAAGEVTTVASQVENTPVVEVSEPEAPAAPVHIVRVNGVEIPHEAIAAEAQNHPAENPGEAMRSAARALVIRELLLQRARSLGVQAAEEFDEQGRRLTEEDALITALLDKDVTTPIADDEACRRYYANNSARFRSSAIHEARHILVAAPRSEPDRRREARELAYDLVAQLRERPEKFAGLAELYSACPSREQGGNLGQITEGSTVPEFEAALDRLQPGELAEEPVETRFGYHVVLLERSIPASQLPFEAVRDRIADYLEASSWSRGVSQYISVLAGSADIEGFDLAGSDGPLVQ